MQYFVNVGNLWLLLISWKTLTVLTLATDENENDVEVKELFEHDKSWQRSWCDMEDNHTEESSGGTLARGDDHSNYTHKQEYVE